MATSIACYGDCYFTVLLKTLGLSALKASSRTEQQKVSQATLTHRREWHARLATWLQLADGGLFTLYKLFVYQSI